MAKKKKEVVAEEEVIDGEVQHIVTAEDVVNNPDGELVEGEVIGIPVIESEEVTPEVVPNLCPLCNGTGRISEKEICSACEGTGVKK